MSDRPDGKLEVDERDIRDRRNHESARQRADVGGALSEPVAEDREVVRAEVPGDADVRLMQAEIDPARRDEAEITERAGLDQRLGSPPRAGCRGTCAPASARDRVASASRMSSRHSAEEAASGFSTNTCLPASRAARPSG